MSFYGDMAVVVTDLLTQFGTAFVLARDVGGSIDDVTGAVVAGTPADQVVTGLLKVYPDKLIDGTRIQQGDRLLVIDASVQPLHTDRPVIEGEEWSVVSIETANPAGIPLAYFIQVRR